MGDSLEDSFVVLENGPLTEIPSTRVNAPNTEPGSSSRKETNVISTSNSSIVRTDQESVNSMSIVSNCSLGEEFYNEIIQENIHLKETVKQNNQALRAWEEQAKKNISTQECIKKQEEELSSKNKEIEFLKVQVLQNKNLIAELDNANAKITQFKNDLTIHKNREIENKQFLFDQKLKDVQLENSAVKIAKLENSLSKITSEKSTLNTLHVQQVELNKTLQNEVRELKQKMEQNESVVAKYEEVLKKVLDERDNLDESKCALEAKVEQIVIENNNVTSENDKELKKLRVRLAAAEDDLKECRLGRAEALAKCGLVSADNESLRSQLAECRSQLDECRSQLDEVRAELVEVSKKSSETVARLVERLENVRDDRIIQEQVESEHKAEDIQPDTDQGIQTLSEKVARSINRNVECQSEDNCDCLICNNYHPIVNIDKREDHS